MSPEELKKMRSFNPSYIDSEVERLKSIPESTSYDYEGEEPDYRKDINAYLSAKKGSTGNYPTIGRQLSQFDRGIESFIGSQPERSNYVEALEPNVGGYSPLSDYDTGIESVIDKQATVPENYVEVDAPRSMPSNDLMPTFRPDSVSDRRVFNNDPRSVYGDAYPEGEKGIYPALSAYKENAGVADTNPIDWGGYYDDNRNQGTRRALVRKYQEDLYNKANKSVDLEPAKESRDNAYSTANIGSALEGLFRSRSMAYGGKGPNMEFWQGIKSDADKRYASEADRKKQAINDYLMKQKLGSQAVEELYATSKAERDMAMQDPRSEQSVFAREMFKQIYPDQADKIGERLNSMSAADIDKYAKLSESAALTGLKTDQASRDQSKLNFEMTKELRDQLRKEKETQYKINKPVSGESPEKKDLLKAQRDYWSKKAEMLGKDKGMSISTKRAIDKERKALDEYQRGAANVLSEFDKGAKIKLIPGVFPSALGGSREDLNVKKAAISAAFVAAIPGLRSDKDFERIIESFVPKATDTPEALKAKRESVKAYLDSKKPATPALDDFNDSISNESSKDLSPRDQEAYNWAKANKNDPISSEILKRLGRE